MQVLDPPRLLREPEYRVEGPLKVTGSARYTADVTMPGMLWLAYTRSDRPHARILSVDVSGRTRVARRPRGADRRGHRRRVPGPTTAGLAGPGQRPRAHHRRPHRRRRRRDARDRRRGCAAWSRSSTRTCRWSRSKMRSTPTRPSSTRTSTRTRYLGNGKRPKTPHPNIHGYSLVEKIGNRRQPRGRLRTRGPCLRAHVFHGARVPGVSRAARLRRLDRRAGPGAHHQHQQVARRQSVNNWRPRWNYPRTQIVIDTTFIGGDFGGKGLSIDEFTCYFLARATGRPDQGGDGLRRRAAGQQCTTLGDHAPAHRGQRGRQVPGPPVRGNHRRRRVRRRQSEPGPGRAGPQHADARTTCRSPASKSRPSTPTAFPGGSMRAPGDPQSMFAGECHVDMIARELGIDPIELRRRNASARWRAERHRRARPPLTRGRGAGCARTRVQLGQPTARLDTAAAWRWACATSAPARRRWCCACWTAARSK